MVASVANNINGSQLGTNYRTGAACPKVTATTFQAAGLCIVANSLPNRDIDMRGGMVGHHPRADGTYNSGVVPVDSASKDLVLLTRAEDNCRARPPHGAASRPLSRLELERERRPLRLSHGPARRTTTGPTAWASRHGPTARCRT
ncbi:hypothetical protein ACRAWD_19910 [Caulobacter segnis]